MSPIFTKSRVAVETLRLARRLRAPLAMVAAAGLAACSAPDNALFSPKVTTARYDHAHPIGLALNAQQLETPVAAELSSRDAESVAAFAREYLARGEGDLTIGYPSDGAAAQAVRAVVAEVERAGVPSARIVRGPYSTKADGDRGVVLWFDALETVAPDCSEAPGDSLHMFMNKTPKRFGCAYQANLAAMIADPRDVRAPRPMSPAVAERRLTVLSNYRQGTKTAAESNGETVKTTDQ